MNEEIKDIIYDLIVGKLPEEALDSEMSLIVVDNSLICEWKNKDECHSIIYKIDMIVDSHSIYSL